MQLYLLWDPNLDTVIKLSSYTVLAELCPLSVRFVDVQSEGLLLSATAGGGERDTQNVAAISYIKKWEVQNLLLPNFFPLKARLQVKVDQLIEAPDQRSCKK